MPAATMATPGYLACRTSVATLLFFVLLRRAAILGAGGAPSPARIVDYLIGYTRVGDMDKLYSQYADRYLDVTLHGCERAVVDPLGDMRHVLASEGASGQEFTASVIWYYVFPDVCFAPVFRREYLRCIRPRKLEDCYTTSPFMWTREFYVDAFLAGSGTGIELLGLNKKLTGTYMLVVRVGTTTRTALVTVNVVGECPTTMEEVTTTLRGNCWRGRQYTTDFNGDGMYLFDTEEEHRRIVYKAYQDKLKVASPNATDAPISYPRAYTGADERLAPYTLQPVSTDDHYLPGCPWGIGCDLDQTSASGVIEIEDHDESDVRLVSYPPPTLPSPGPGGNENGAGYSDNRPDPKVVGPTVGPGAIILVVMCAPILIGLTAFTIRKYC
ncbi:glycoprotein D [Psittacid alphaherpesvirus 1]|uniref:Envelope glycoprotein D n=1 Tax=Psittacid herpesvirus 1 (isolate Amazon parrot/-/97-0001/1997) TaxID=670426 RepID=GD_PSHV1|nr:envelope glycoprotein D [Psittacid alphaherpesvirus 1]Q6UDF6.1 RecName: Full=Envelope glycoprotein D; Short=gD; Flags: Precursor [Psittacid herpesvirus 1 Amazon parrot/1997]AAQ73754.1 glycoprotein D [Psittacid alphaherpesvirus 1]